MHTGAPPVDQGGAMIRSTPSHHGSISGSSEKQTRWLRPPSRAGTTSYPDGHSGHSETGRPRYPGAAGFNGA